MYHTEVIKLLALATKEKHTENQKWVHQRLSLTQLAECLRTMMGCQENAYRLEAAYIQLLCDAFVNSARRSFPAEAFGDVVQILPEMLGRLTDEFTSGAGQPAKVESVVFDTLLPTLHMLYRNYPALKRDEQADSDAVSREVQLLQQHSLRLAASLQSSKGVEVTSDVIGRVRTLNELLAELSDVFSAEKMLTNALGRSLRAQEKLGEQSTSSLTLAPPPSKRLSKSSPVASANEDDTEGLIPFGSSMVHPQEYLSKFVDDLIPATATEEEFSGLVDIFKRDVDTVLEQQESRTKVIRAGATKQLIMQLMAQKQGSTDDGKLPGDRMHQTSTCLRLLSRLLHPPDVRRQRAL